MQVSNNNISTALEVITRMVTKGSVEYISLHCNRLMNFISVIFTVLLVIFCIRRLRPSCKFPDTKSCQMVSIIRNPFTGSKYMCAALNKQIFLYEWFSPRSTFIEIKRVRTIGLLNAYYHLLLGRCPGDALPFT